MRVKFRAVKMQSHCMVYMFLSVFLLLQVNAWIAFKCMYVYVYIYIYIYIYIYMYIFIYKYIFINVRCVYLHLSRPLVYNYVFFWC